MPDTKTHQSSNTQRPRDEDGRFTESGSSGKSPRKTDHDHGASDKARQQDQRMPHADNPSKSR